MRCLKCKEYKITKRKYSDDRIKELLLNWYICNKCESSIAKIEKEKAHKYYINNKDRYRELHIGYKSNLSNSYVANGIVDKTSLKAKDIPQDMIDAKRQYMKTKRILKERED